MFDVESVKAGRPMKYPYTYAAKIAQFPYRYHFNNSWLFKYHLIACLVCFPIFLKIQNMSYSPENVAKWDEIRRKEFEGH
ncbi:uncharacterized protein LOC105702446 [Orussus abietinus]|uniref:uncharacterized protein LOC105702446 n=1 Tax=Orussus abietinus TaxID=222816 RepID=UPI0006251166|nr:uncharacterized protein LOC105702446 [Orussus abietinus]